MSGSSDSDEYYDAEDNTPNKSTRKPKLISLTPSKSESDFQSSLKQDDKSLDFSAPPRVPSSLALQTTAFEFSGIEKCQSNRHRLRELRQRMQTEDDEVFSAVGTSPTSSQTSSFDGIFPGPDTKSSHPFRIIEHDALSLHSLTSLGRIGRIMSCAQESGSTQAAVREPSTEDSFSGSTSTLKSPSDQRRDSDTKDQSDETFEKPVCSNLQEPDVIASTKASTSSQSQYGIDSNLLSTNSSAPVAPPRRRKKAKTGIAAASTLPMKKEASQLVKVNSVEKPDYRGATLPSPNSTIESITREFENSLDITAATKGQYVVKPQDNGENKSKGMRSTAGRNSSTYPMGGTIGSGGCRERRKSAGDEQMIPNQLNMFVRTRTDSGKPLSDLVTVLNLDTGERVPLSIAEDKLPQCINPLSLHIMRLTSEYVSNTSLEKGHRESDDDSLDSKRSGVTGTDGEAEAGMVKRKTAQIKKFLGSTVKKTMNKARTIRRHNKEEPVEYVDDTTGATSVTSGEQYIKLKASNSHKGPYEFDCVQHVQDLSGEHIGPVWCMKFSSCGRLLATAGQDRVLRVWVVRNAYPYFQDMRTKYMAEKVSPTPSQESIVSQISVEDPNSVLMELCDQAPFMPKPFCTYSAHTSDLLDVSWSKNYFILSSSMDKTVRLWHISRKECLCCFQHIDFVTAIVFYPRDDRYFLSGSLDGKLRLWNIPDKKVAVWNEIGGPAKLITAANFCQNGKFAVVGSYDGRCIFFTMDQLKYHTQINVRSSRGKNSTGRKISGIEPMPGEDKILVTSNDSRIRLYDLRDLNLSCKYKGYANFSSQIKASFSHDGKYITSGSENQCIYIWKSNHDYSKFPSVRRDRNDFWEGIKVHNAVVTCAVFSPNPDIIMRQIEELEGNTSGVHTTSGYVLVSADFNGCIKVFLNKTKPKHSSLPASAMA
ncbi:WD repeat-containing protein 44 isoform X2 [Cimex lectularius]|uniref:WD repeat-containing protein 44 n=1 Tax=Cimex lectularius TaxID=79782 RepID=A0A8I6SBE3_CIMLE|nr:WD repeat-containing protein 44 isoform X2 [Cimex lectularius]